MNASAPIVLWRKPAFWIGYALLAAIALAVAWRLFPLAIPLVNLDIKLARHDAIAKASARAAELKLVADDARSAVRFRSDDGLQSYVELEAGGKAAFAALVAGGVYAPYWWDVRLFTPGGITEATLRFRPDGTSNGFSQRLAESYVPADPALLAPDSDVARGIAEARARADWGVDLAPYALIERTQQKATNGRVDHRFVYERRDGNLGESRFRLRLGTTGDALTEVAFFSFVPESFDRRFQALRSANNTIANAASLATGLLYGLGGCIFGVLWLLRRHWLLWRPALIAGGVVGALMGAMTLAAAPTAWFAFDTAQSAGTFWARQIGGALLTAAGGALGYGLVFMAGESLSRRAFGAHPQLWRVWSREAAASPQIVGRTLGGLMFVPIELAFIAAFYYASNRWLGWWQPSEALTDPNILGSAVPALAPIAQSLQAGFMEECLFRAVPLSLAALIGAHYGRRNLAIGIMVVVQALVFGAAHANYPGFPAYSRLVELALPAMVWALIFLRFGLVPTIILHATFDLVLFAIPVFLVDAPGSFAQRLLVVAAALSPLAVIAVQRVRAGAWRDLPAAMMNAAWRPAMADHDAHAAHGAHRAHDATSAVVAFQRALPLVALASLAVWIACAAFRTDVPPMQQGRADAIAAADAALVARGIALGPEWRRAAAPKLAPDEAGQRVWHKFVWQEAGADAYRALVGRTLAPPLWEVRYARYDGPVDERAEEWRVTINPDGSVRGVHHALPEGRAGARLARADALVLARNALKQRYGDNPDTLTEVGAEETQRPARTDWTFAFADPRIDVGKGGEARTVLMVAGDEVASSGRYVHVPESWLRMQRERDGRYTILKFALGGLFALVGVAALVFGVLRWTRGLCDRRALVVVASIALAASALAIVNRWPEMAMALDTAEPIASQVALGALQALLAGAVGALLYGMAAGVGAYAAQRQPALPLAGPLPAWAAGAAAALMSAGAGALFQYFVPQTTPRWPDASVAGAWWPPLAAALDGVQVLTMASTALFALACIAAVTRHYAERRWAAVCALVLVYCAGGIAAGQEPLLAMAAGSVEGTLTAIVIYAVLRFDARTVPAFIVTGMLLHALQRAIAAGTPSAWIAAAIMSVVGVAVAWQLVRYLERTRVEALPAAAT